jgi:GxxExxY protein
MGPGFLEGIYEEAMTLELRACGIPFEQQVRIPVTYRDIDIGESVLDLVVDGSVVVELKAILELRPIHHAQVISYLRAGGFQLGLLVNFNVYRLLDGVRRIVYLH